MSQEAEATIQQHLDNAKRYHEDTLRCLEAMENEGGRLAEQIQELSEEQFIY